jgi:hypothetical protein
MHDANAQDKVNQRNHEQYQEGNELDNIDNDKPIKFKKEKSHGLILPLHPQQVVTWIITSILVITFYLFLAPGTYFIHTAWVATICIVYGLLLLGTFFY